MPTLPPVIAIRLAALLVVAGLAAAPAPAEQTVPAARDQIALSFAPVVRRAAPAVVNIYATRVVPQRVSPFADDPFFSQFFDFGRTVPRVQNALGSGVIVRPEGIVVSNFHVVGGADEIRVVLADREEFEGRVILADEAADIAVIRLDEAANLPFLELADSDAAEVGDLVLAIGNPFGVGQTVTSGIVSGLARAGARAGGGGRGYFIQTDAAINPGNSGGALVDIEGRLLGINTSILTRSGGSNGIGFAIPSNLVARYVEAAVAGRTTLEMPWPGIEVQVVDAGIAEALGLPVPQGIVIRQMHEESPFAAAGLRPGDVITDIDGHPVDGAAELAYRLMTAGVGAEVTAGYWRDGARGEARVTLIAAPGGSEADVLRLSAGTIFDGIAVARLDPALTDRLGLPLDLRGVVVTEVAGRALRTRLRPGDVILAVNGRPIATLEDFQAAAIRPSRNWAIEILRGGQRIAIRLAGG